MLHPVKFGGSVPITPWPRRFEAWRVTELKNRMSKATAQFLRVMLLAALVVSPLACATKEPAKKTEQQLRLEAEQEVKMVALAKVVMAYLVTPEKQEKQYQDFIFKMMERAKMTKEATQVKVVFTCAGKVLYGHYDLNAKALTMGDPPLEPFISRVYLSLADIRFIKCAVHQKRIDLRATESPAGEYTLTPLGAWDID